MTNPIIAGSVVTVIIAIVAVGLYLIRREHHKIETNFEKYFGFKMPTRGDDPTYTDSYKISSVILNVKSEIDKLRLDQSELHKKLQMYSPTSPNNVLRIIGLQKEIRDKTCDIDQMRVKLEKMLETTFIAGFSQVSLVLGYHPAEKDTELDFL